MPNNVIDKLEEAVRFIRSKSALQPRVGIILGSGLGAVLDAAEIDAAIQYQDIPNAPSSSVIGHSGRLVLGRASEVPVVVMQGRVHYYEGFSTDEVMFLPRVMGHLGIETAIVTNAAGGLHTDLGPGDLMLITDHLNLSGINPLRGRNIDELGPRFPDMTEAYPKRLRDVARDAAREVGLTLKEGVYIWLAGPTYETPAETRMARLLGADATGMSTVPEVIALAHMSIPVLGISCITNLAPGILPQKVSHDEVLETTARVSADFGRLLLAILARL